MTTAANNNDFLPLEHLLEEYTSRIGGNARKVVAGQIAHDLRNANRVRIRKNEQPPSLDPMTPRKTRRSDSQGKQVLRSKRLRDELTRKKVTVRQDRMFQRAVAPRYLRKTSSDGEAQVGFVGAMARIMRVHQYGLEDGVTRAAGAPRVRYPARVVIGMTAEDRAKVMERVMDWLGS